MTVKSTIKVGRRKTAVARAYLSEGTGKVTINGKNGEDYVKSPSLFQSVLQPFKVTNTLGTLDVKINVAGGGFTGQIGAIKLGIARALVERNEEFKSVLRQNGFMTRDPRMVERKKYGRPKARKRFQFSKR
ncbi:MAG: 30S ribosomal protein S9 [Ignavibacteriae bacterium]|nr:30S ribosomal protein S9 [Ignavibacteriota bacterium]